MIAIFALSQNQNFLGINIELPILVDELPEGWRLPAIYNLVAHTAFVSIAIVFVLRHVFAKKSFESITIVILLMTSVIGFILLGLTWHKTVIINERHYSLYFLFFSFIIFVTDYCGGLLFLPYLSRYQSVMMRAFFLGDAISSGLLAVLGIIQNTAKTECISVMVDNKTQFTEERSSPRLSVTSYFVILSMIIFISLIAFVALLMTRVGLVKNDENLALIEGHAVDQVQNEYVSTDVKRLWLSRHGFYLVAMFWTCFLTYGKNSNQHTFKTTYVHCRSSTWLTA